MAGLMQRTMTIIKARYSKLLNRAERPSETLDYSYERQLELLQNVKRGVADVVTAKKRLQLQTQTLEQNVVKLDTQARQALGQGREDLAPLPERLARLRVELDDVLLEGLRLQLETLLGRDDVGDAPLHVLEQLELPLVRVVEGLGGPFRPVEQLRVPRLDDRHRPLHQPGHLALLVAISGVAYPR